MFRQITKYPPLVVRKALGDIGNDLLYFSKEIDLDHPDMGYFNLSKKIYESFSLVNLAIKNNLEKSIEGIEDLYSSELQFYKEIGCLEKAFPRFLKSRKKIQMIRRSKKISNVYLNNFFKSPRTIWDNSPNDFEIFLKNKSYNSYLEEAEEMISKFRNLGCDEMADHIEFNLNKIKSVFKNNYFGYKELSISNAAVILSKMHNFKLQRKHSKWEISYKNLEYKPKVFPLHYIKKIKKQRITNLICDLEKKPLFDHYFVVVPSYLKGNKKFSNDEILNKISKNDIIPVVMGERGFKTYFISYWT